MTLLHVAILRGFTDIVSILLQVDNDGGQVDVNEADTVRLKINNIFPSSFTCFLVHCYKN